MKELKTFVIEQPFESINELYKYLIKNVKSIEELSGIQIQKPIKVKPFCIVGREIITERNILFFASNSDFPENMGELIFLASTFAASVVVFFGTKSAKFHIDTIKWLHNICNDDTQFIIGEILIN